MSSGGCKVRFAGTGARPSFTNALTSDTRSTATICVRSCGKNAGGKEWSTLPHFRFHLTVHGMRFCGITLCTRSMTTAQHSGKFNKRCRCVCQFGASDSSLNFSYPASDAALREPPPPTNQRFATLFSLPFIHLLPWRQPTARTEQDLRLSLPRHRQMSCRQFCLTSIKRHIRTNLAQRLKPSLQPGTLLAAGLVWRRFVTRGAVTHQQASS